MIQVSMVPLTLIQIVDDAERELGHIRLLSVPRMDETIWLWDDTGDRGAWQVVGVRHEAHLEGDSCRVCVFVDPIMAGILRSEAQEQIDRTGGEEELVATTTLAHNVITGPITFQDLMTYKPVEVEGARLAHYLVDSKLLKSFGYSFDSHDFEAQFHNGAIWSYADVAEALFYEFLADESHGGFFIDKIRGVEWVKNPLHVGTKLKEGVPKRKRA